MPGKPSPRLTQEVPDAPSTHQLAPDGPGGPPAYRAHAAGVFLPPSTLREVGQRRAHAPRLPRRPYRPPNGLPGRLRTAPRPPAADGPRRVDRILRAVPEGTGGRVRRSARPLHA